MAHTAPLPRPGRCLIVRADCGHPPVTAPASWVEGDPSRQPLGECLLLPDASRGLLLRRAEWVLAWAGTREGAGLWKKLARIAKRRGLCLECRFPRHARELATAIEFAGVEPTRWESPANGLIPPLYEALSPEALRLQIAYEWESAVGAARGGAALLRIAVALAREGATPAPSLALRLGLSAGATRAYLRWMEDVALVRRDGRTFDLRHPLLRGLFLPVRRGESRSPVSPLKKPSEVDWD